MLSPAPDVSETTPALVDWPAWGARWEAQQHFMVLRREERFQVMLDVAEEIVGKPQRVLDLACGTGSISQRGLARFPSAQFVAQDLDPLLMSIGRGTLGDAGGRLSWVRADLRETNWLEPLRPHAPFDAIVTSTALHWLTATDILRVYVDLAAVTRPGGVVLNADRLPVGAPAGGFGQATENVRKRQVAEAQTVTAPAESWIEWWTAAESEPAFVNLIAERNRLFEDNPSPRDLLTAAFHLEALRMAGFTETAVVWRYLDYSVVAAIR
jgi:ubiquinone/menaquinone biosynthesis C-methylase UbiE